MSDTPVPFDAQVIPPALAAQPAPKPARKPVGRKAPAASTDAPEPAEHPSAAVPAVLADQADTRDTTMDTTTMTAQTDAMKAQAETMFADAAAKAQGVAQKGQKMVEDATAFGKGNVEALVESSKIAVRGFETIGQNVADYARKSFDDASAAFRTLAAVKSPTEFVKVQSDMARNAFDALVAESARSTETVLKLASEVAQPIQNRVAVAVEKIKVAA